MRKLRVIRVMAALAALVAVLVIGPSSASAHNVVIFHGYDKAVIGENNDKVTVCDEERDGHYVWAEVKYVGIIDREADGGDAGCDTQKFGMRYDEFRLCEESKGCTAWYSV